MAKTEERTIYHEGIVITYELTIKSVKNINLRVKRDGTVSVSANRRVNPERIDAFVLKNAEMILSARKKLAKIEEKALEHRKLNHGDTVTLFGKSFLLEIFLGEENHVRIRDNYLLMELSDPENQEKKEALFQRFLTEYATAVFQKLLEEYYPFFSEDTPKLPTLRVKQMKTRWGSCMPQKGIITMNLRLAYAPLSCSRFVMLHEYCHFRYQDHSKGFYAHLERFCPEWKEEKQRLEQSGA